MNDFEDEPGVVAHDRGALIGDGSQPQLLDDTFIRQAPNLGDARPGGRLLEEESADPQGRAPILRSAMKGGRRRFLADAEERTRTIAADALREQGKEREPKSKELKKARKLMFDEVPGGKDALKRAAIPQERRQFNRVGFAPNKSLMDFDLTDAPQEIAAQKESDKNLWNEMRGGAVGSKNLFESRARVKTEDEQQNAARKNAFHSEERSENVLSANRVKLAGHLQNLLHTSPEEANSNAYLADRSFQNPFKHTVGAAHSDATSIHAKLSRPRISPSKREALIGHARLLASADSNNTDATEHALAQGQTRAYSRGSVAHDPTTGEQIRDAKTKKPLMEGNERADVVRYANNRGSGLSRFFGGVGNFFSKILPGTQRLFGASRDTRFESAPGQREARDLLRQERDTFRRDARSGKLGFMRKFFGRTAGSGRSRLPIGPRPNERPSTRAEYADEQRALAAQPAAGPGALIQPEVATHKFAVPPVDQGADNSLDGEEIKQAAEQPDDQLLELSSMDGMLGHDDE